MSYARRILETKLERLREFRALAEEEAFPVNQGELFAACEDLEVAINVLRARAEEDAKEDAKAAKSRRARRASSPPPAGDEPETKPQTPVAKERKRRGRPPKARPEGASTPAPQDELPLERRDTEAPPPPSGSVSTFGELDIGNSLASVDALNGGAP